MVPKYQPKGINQIWYKSINQNVSIKYGTKISAKKYQSYMVQKYHTKGIYQKYGTKVSTKKYEPNIVQ
ncbi:hypothetical protein CDAR_212441, partial [Caerostris darwini]